VSIEILDDDIAIIIPARYQSSRFPGKPLVDILGMSMICRVWRQCIKVLPSTQVFVATDSKEIADHCEECGIQVLMTSDTCLTGTDRVYEASKQINAKMVVNVQGDEPLIDPSDIHLIIQESKKNPDKIINAMCRLASEEDFRSTTIPKVVFRQDRRLLYMSRAGIPTNKNHDFIASWKQVCIYAFPAAALKKFSQTKKKSHFESIEDIEILRFLEMGFDVQMVEVSQSSIAIDVPADVDKVEKVLHA